MMPGPANLSPRSCRLGECRASGYCLCPHGDPSKRTVYHRAFR